MAVSTDLRHEMANAIMEAIIETNRLSGAAEALINPMDALQALIVATAALLESDPNLTSLRSLREMSEATGKQIHRQAKLFREQYEKTGMRAWETRPVVTQ